MDLFHAREHLHDLARLLEFMLGDQQGRMARRPAGRPRLRRHRRHLQPPPASTPSPASKKDELDTALGYFENNAPRMRYHWFRSRGLFVGSGVIEAGCKTVTGQRLKQSGMHSTAGGADAIITLRCREASSERETICNTPHTQTANRLTSPSPRMILVTYKIEAHPAGTRHALRSADSQRKRDRQVC